MNSNLLYWLFGLFVICIVCVMGMTCNLTPSSTTKLILLQDGGGEEKKPKRPPTKRVKAKKGGVQLGQHWLGSSRPSTTYVEADLSMPSTINQNDKFIIFEIKTIGKFCSFS